MSCLTGLPWSAAERQAIGGMFDPYRTGAIDYRAFCEYLHACARAPAASVPPPPTATTGAVREGHADKGFAGKILRLKMAPPLPQGARASVHGGTVAAELDAGGVANEPVPTAAPVVTFAVSPATITSAPIDTRGANHHASTGGAAAAAAAAPAASSQAPVYYRTVNNARKAQMMQGSLAHLS
jgi:hypothetical protein